MQTTKFGMSRSTVATIVALLLSVVGVVAPARATTATPPTSISFSQSNGVLSATVTVPEGESVGTVSASIGSTPAVTLSEVGGVYPLEFSSSDIGKTVYFYATAVGPELDESFPPTSQSYVLRTAKKPTSISVSQNGMTVTATPVLAVGTEVGVVTVKVGNALTPIVLEPVDGAYSVTLNRSDLMSSLIFTATATESGYPESDVTRSNPFMFTAANAPQSVTVTQSGLTFTAHISVGASQSIGTVTVQVGSADPEVVTSTGGTYSKTIDLADLGKSIVFTATATESGKAESAATASSAFNSASAQAPSSVTVTQSNLTLTAHVTVAPGDSIGVVTVKVGDGSVETVTPVGGVYAKTLTRSQLSSTVVFTATATSSDLPDSEPTSSDPFSPAVAAAPTSVVVSQNDLTLTAAITFADGTTAGPVTATVGSADPVTVEPVGGAYSITLPRTDLGKDVIFTAVGSATGLPDSDSVSSAPVTFAAATAPSSVTISRDGLTLTANVFKSLGQEIGTVTVQIGTGAPTVVEPVDGQFAITLTRSEFDKDVVFRATTTESGKAESSATASDPFNLSVAVAPSSVTASQDGLTVTADVQVGVGESIGTVTVQVGTDAPDVVLPVEGVYSVTLTRNDLTKAVVFTATATAAGKEESDPTTSNTLVFSAAAAPTVVTATQNGLVVTAGVTVAPGNAVGAVTATVGTDDPIAVTPVGDSYAIELTRADAGKTVVFTATATASGKAVSDPTSSDVLTFSVAASPTAITVTQDNLTLDAVVTWTESTTPGSVKATVGSASPVTVSAVDGVYSLTLTRSDLGKSVVFSAIAASAGLPDSDAFTSEPFTFAATDAPSAVTVTQNGLVVSAAVTVGATDAIGTVTAKVGSADPVVITAVDDVYSIELTRADAGKTVIFAATATSADKAESDATSSDPLTFSLAQSPTAITVTQTDFTVSASVTFAEGTTAGAVTATVGDGDPVTIEPVDDLYSVTLTRDDLGKSVVFSAVGTQSGLADSEPLLSEPFVFAAAAAPSAVTVSQSGLVVTASIVVAEGDAVGTVTATIGTGDPVTVEPVDDVYSVELTRADVGSSVVFTATATSSGKAESNVTSSEPFTFGAAAAPTAITVEQSGYDVTAHISVAEGDEVGVVTVQLGTNDAVVVDPVGGAYTVTIAPEDVAAEIVFSATAVRTGVAESEPTTSEPFTLATAQAPTSVTLAQSGLVVTATIEIGAEQAVGVVTATVGTDDPVTVDAVEGVYSITLTREQIGQDVTFSATATELNLIESGATTSDPLTVAAAEAPTAVTLSQSGMNIAASIELPDGVSVGSVTAVVDGADPVDVPLVGSDYTLTLTRTDFGKSVVISATGSVAGLPESDPVESDALTFAVSASPGAVFISQNALTLTVAAFVACGGDPATYGSVGTVTMSVNGGAPETLTTVGGRAYKTLTRSQLGQSVVVTGTGVCGNLPESDPVTRAPYTFRIAPSPTAITVRQSGYVVLARPVLGQGETVGSVTVSIDGGDPTVLTPFRGSYRVTLTRSDFGKSLVFTATARLVHYAESEPTTSSPLVFQSAAAPTGISVTQSGLRIYARVSIPAGQTYGPVSLSIDGGAPLAMAGGSGVYSKLLTRSQLGSSIVVSTTSRKSSLPDSDPAVSSAFTFAAAAKPTSVVLHQSGVYISATIVLPEGQAVGRVTASVNGGTPTLLVHSASGYVKRFTHSSNGKSVVFYVTSTKDGKAVSDVLASAPLTYVG